MIDNLRQMSVGKHVKDSSDLNRSKSLAKEFVHIRHTQAVYSDIAHEVTISGMQLRDARRRRSRMPRYTYLDLSILGHTSLL